VRLIGRLRTSLGFTIGLLVIRPASSAASEIPFCPDTDAVFFFTMHPEHDHAVGDRVAGDELLSLQLSRDVPGVNAD
jgi:hypothetical protein